MDGFSHTARKQPVKGTAWLRESCVLHWYGGPGTGMTSFSLLRVNAAKMCHSSKTPGQTLSDTGSSSLLTGGRQQSPSVTSGTWGATLYPGMLARMWQGGKAQGSRITLPSLLPRAHFCLFLSVIEMEVYCTVSSLLNSCASE